MTTTRTETARELRRFLFDENFTCIINGVEYNNADARRFLYDLENQDQAVTYTETGILQLTFNI